MRVAVVDHTCAPLEKVAFAAGVCYGKRDIVKRRALQCIAADHLSVLEHVSVSFLIEGVSRDLLAQITRHRFFSFCVKSQRYCKVGEREGFFIPEVLEADDMDAAKADYIETVNGAYLAYARLVDTYGLKAEDARYVLPGCALTDIYATVNMRELLHFLDLRMDEHAQAEIRELAREMLHRVADIGDDYVELFEAYGYVGVL